MISLVDSCTSAPLDPCNRVADELARIVFDSYRKVDTLTGIRVVIGSAPHELSVDPRDIKFQKALTLAEWRRELSLGS